MVNDKTYESFNQYLKDSEYKLIRKSSDEEIKNNSKLSDKVLIEHKCGNQIFVRPYDFMRGKVSKCKVCYNNAKNFKDFVDKIKDYELVSEYKNDKTNIKIKHISCGTIWEVRPSHFKAGTRCPNCSRKDHSKIMKEISKDKIKTNEEFINEVKSLVGDEYIFLEKYGKNRFEKIKCKHNTCGYIWKIRPNDFLNGHRCPKCFHNFSKGEKEVVSFIKEIYSGKILENEKINNKEIDIYLPELNIAIEFDGLYWHSEEFKDKNYHLEKTIKCEEKGIRLIHIFEDEWNYSQDIIKSKLQHILGCNNNPKIYARKCYIEEISTQDKNIFLEENHIQGKDQAQIKLGLWYPNNEEDILVGVMTFCKPRKSLGQSKDSKFDYELSRFATENSYRVIGGFSKLWSYFEKNYKYSSIITYADRRWSVGNVYENNGFILDHTSKPNYWYLNSKKCKKREYRYKYRKQKLQELFPNIYDDNKSESQIMKEAGYIKIWDCGNLVYIKKNLRLK